MFYKQENVAFLNMLDEIYRIEVILILFFKNFF